jgi:hypothetical protein
MNKTLGKIGYILRELLNEIHWFIVGPFSKVLITIIDWLDKKPSIAYWRKKDRRI